MGNNNVSHRDFRRISLKSPFQSRSKGVDKSSLSHTFSFIEENGRIDKVNVNQASEEELMTLPGVTRQIAQAVVEHRKAIGRYKKVEDLALVRGVGALKLEQIRPEICVHKSYSSSRAPSVDSLKSSDSRLTLKCARLVDVNKAGVFELQCVHGITQEMAAAIVHYRSKRGSYKKLDDLIHVRNIDRLRLSNIRQYLTVISSEQEAEKSPPLMNGSLNGYRNGTVVGKSPKAINTAPVKLNLTNSLALTSIHNIYELLSAYSHRPILEEDFKYKRNGRDAVRVATWNLHNFTEEKASNYGVKEVISRTILENRWSVVILQEILEPKALKIICDELNDPKLQRVIDWKDNSQNWNFCMLDSHLGFLYDKSNNGLTLELVSLSPSGFTQVPTLVAYFAINSFKMVLLNVQLPENFSYEAADEMLRDVVSESCDCIVLLGDFSNVSPRNMEHRKDLGGMQAVLPLGTNTGCPNSKLKCCDNILVNTHAQRHLTGSWGIVKEGLTHLAIPNGWTWGGTASPHCPLWVEVYVVESPL